MPLNLSQDLKLPESAATTKFAFLGMSGYGKSYAAGVLVEELLGASVQVVVIDPVGIWWALRLGADGRSPAFPIPVFGGDHGDLPLEPTGGELVAQIAAERRSSMVLDVSAWTQGEQRRFVTAFATELFQRKKSNRSPVHLVFEEAHEFFPQVSAGDGGPVAVLVGATNRIWKIGRNYGIGGTLVSQRTAEVSKSALWMTETVVTTRMRAPNDVKQIDGWANHNGGSAKAVALLPSLPKRQVVVWADERKAMAATIEEAKQNDPKILRARIAELERIGKTIGAADRESIAAVQRERDTYKADRDAALKARDLALGRLTIMRDQLRDIASRARGATEMDELQVLNLALPTPEVKKPYDIPRPRDVAEILPRVTVTSTATNGAPKPTSNSGIARMLTALAEMHPTPLTYRQLGTLAVMRSANSGTFSNYLAKLSTGGLITREGGLVRITAAGLTAAGPVQKPATPRALLTMWGEKLPGKAADMLEWLAAERVPKTNAQLADFAGLTSKASGTFSNYLSKLTTNGLAVRVPGKGLRAVEELWLR